ncbi:MAG: CtsR family transcriptional regulator [Clostridium sp.]
MAKLSDLIEEFIKELVEQSTDNQVEIQRNELAGYFSCAPSQINYVLSTRFTQEKGYFIESKRGGGGCIRIIKIEYKVHNNLLDILSEKIGDYITYNGAIGILEALYETNILTKREAEIIKITLNDRTLAYAGNGKNRLRADILKSILFNILE